LPKAQVHDILSGKQGGRAGAVPLFSRRQGCLRVGTENCPWINVEGVISIMKKVCDLCGWEYNEEEGYPEGGIEPGTKWEDIPDDFVCPLCGAGKDEFSDAD
jgi:rubredoxin-NAD+ reductase